MFEFITQVVSEYATEWRRQIAICELGKLNDHLLADIGLRRDQLPTYLIEESTEGHREPSRRLAPRAELVGCG
jgi:uncharacterized protein YjiS (DUF1127 family)